MSAPHTRWITGWLLTALLSGPALVGAANTGCKGFKQAIPRTYYAGATAQQAQRGLMAVYGGDPSYQAELRSGRLSDGLIGRTTRQWLGRFCADFPAVTGDQGAIGTVLQAVGHYAQIAATFPDWRTTLASSRFRTWVAASSDGRRQIRRSGSAPMLVALLQEYAGAPTAPGGMASGCTTLDATRPLDTVLGALQTRGLAPAAALAKQRLRHGIAAAFGEAKPAALDTQGLVRFCQAFPVTGQGTELLRNVLLAALHFDSLAVGRENWRDLLRDPEFTAWINAPVTAGEIDQRRLRLSGAVSVLLRLLDDYANTVPAPAPEPPAARPVACPPQPGGNQALYYWLDADDIKQLAARGKLMDQLQALVGSAYPSQSARDDAIDQALQTLQPQCLRERFVAGVGNLPSPGTGFRLDAVSLQTLLQDPTLFKDLPKASQVLAGLKGLQDQIFGSRAQLRELASSLVEAQIPAQQSPAAASALAAATAKADETAPKAETAGSGAPGPQATPDAQTGPSADQAAPVQQAPAAAPTKSAATPQTEKQGDGSSAPEAKPNRSTGKGSKAAPTTAVEATAQTAKIDAATKAFAAAVANAAQPVNQYRIDAAAINRGIGAAGLVELPKALLASLKPVVGVPYPNVGVFQSAVGAALERTAASPGGEAASLPSPDDLAGIQIQAGKTGDDQPRTTLAVEDCGCALDWDTVGKGRFIVYGLHPLWRTGQPEAVDANKSGDPPTAALSVDFSVLTRIGYQALRLDGKGKLLNLSSWQQGARAFLAKAHRYRSRVDLVIDAPDWADWDDAAQAQAIQSIVDLFDPERIAETGRPDGLLLYLPGYFQKVGKAARVVSLVNKLRGGIGPDMTLSLLLDSGDLRDSEAIETGQVDQGPFGSLSDILTGEKAVVDLVLVYLDHPVTAVKKRLRLLIENELQGDRRIEALRKVLPVIPPVGHRRPATAGAPTAGPPSCAIDDYAEFWQLHHDLLYFRDNFRGVAFWPLPLTTDADYPVLKNTLLCAFAQTDAEATGASSLPLLDLVPEICVYVCPNRVLVQSVFAGLFALLAAILALAWLRCQVRTMVVRHLPWVLALGGVVILIFVALVTCDPIWNEWQVAILSGLLVLLIAVLLGVYIRKIRQGPLP